MVDEGVDSVCVARHLRQTHCDDAGRTVERLRIGRANVRCDMAIEIVWNIVERLQGKRMNVYELSGVSKKLRCKNHLLGVKAWRFLSSTNSDILFTFYPPHTSDASWLARSAVIRLITAKH